MIKYIFKILSITFILCSGIWFQSCTEEIPTLSGANQKLADSLIIIEKTAMLKEIDSLCNESYKERFDKAVDSVSAVRLKEIDKLIGVGK